MGLNIVSVPKTIDNDIWGTDFSFGFDSAVSIATDAIDRLHSTASSHKRVMVIEVMGHKAGWIALYSGMAGGGDVILIPELSYNIHNIGDTILNRLKKGKPYSIVVVAEGIQTDGRKRAAEYIAQEIEYETGIETRETVLGYIQRGGSPTPFDRNLSTRMGGHATELIAGGQFGRMVTLKGNEISSAPLEEIAGKLKLVTEDHDLVVQGKRMGNLFRVNLAVSCTVSVGSVLSVASRTSDVSATGVFSVTVSFSSAAISSFAAWFCILAVSMASLKASSLLIFFNAICAAFCCDSFLE